MWKMGGQRHAGRKRTRGTLVDLHSEEAFLSKLAAGIFVGVVFEHHFLVCFAQFLGSDAAADFQLCIVVGDRFFPLPGPVVCTAAVQPHNKHRDPCLLCARKDAALDLPIRTGPQSRVDQSQPLFSCEDTEIPSPGGEEQLVLRAGDTMVAASW